MVLEVPVLWRRTMRPMVERMLLTWRHARGSVCFVLQFPFKQVKPQVRILFAASGFPLCVWQSPGSQKEALVLRIRGDYDSTCKSMECVLRTLSERVLRTQSMIFAGEGSYWRVPGSGVSMLS